jgi:hypothetical protein
MNFRKIVIGGVLFVVGVPVLFVLIAVVFFYAAFYFPNRTSAISGTIVSSGQRREYGEGKRPPMARAQADAGIHGRTVHSQHRRDGPDVGVLS